MAILELDKQPAQLHSMVAKDSDTNMNMFPNCLPGVIQVSRGFGS